MNEQENNAESDGIIIWIHKWIRNRGLMRRKSYCFKFIVSRGISGNWCRDILRGGNVFNKIRTDNDIKNHFYSTLRRSLRRLNKFIGEKNSTTQMREIKPSVLSTIMNYIYELENNIETNIVDSLKGISFHKWIDLPYLIFEFSNYKPVKSKVKL